MGQCLLTMISAIRESKMTEEKKGEAKSSALKHIKAILITLVTVIITVPVTWYLPKFLEKKHIEIALQELSLSGGRYVYLIDISNEGRVPVQDVDLLALVNGNVYSSMFKGSPTTRDPYFRLTKSPFNGRVKINEEDSLTTIQYPYSQEKQNTQSEAIEILKQSARNLINSKSSVWYKVNITPFYLTVDEKLKASIITDGRIDESKIKCSPNPEICKISRVDTISREKFERIFGAMGVQQGNISNKIFGSGIGMSNRMIKGAAVVDAKQKAIKDFYTDIVQKLYGVKVKSIMSQYAETSTNSENVKKVKSEYSNTVSLLSEGMIDRSAAIIYHESSEQMESGEILYEVRGYYELPEEIELSDEYAKIDSGFMLPSAPIELEGEQPGWVIDEPIDNNNVIISSVGTSDPNTPYAMAKVQAANRALLNMSLTLRVRVSNMIKNYAKPTNDTTKQQIEKVVTSVTKQVADNKLIGSRIIAYYKDNKNALVHALAVIPDNVVKWSVDNTVQNIHPNKNAVSSSNSDATLWQQFKAQKAQDELAAEIAKLNDSKQVQLENEKVLWQQFKAQKTQDELAAEIANMGKK